MKKNHKITSHSCTQVMRNHYRGIQDFDFDLRKTPIDGTEKLPRQSKYSKDDTEKDSYP